MSTISLPLTALNDSWKMPDWTTTTTTSPAPDSTGDDENVDVNANGTAAGLSDDLDVCCWHQQFTAWPAFLVPLATYNGSTEVAGLGGAAVVIGPVTGGPTLTLDPLATTEPPTTLPPSTVPPTTEPGTTTPGSTTPGSTAPATTRPGTGVSPATGARPVSGRPTFTG